LRAVSFSVLGLVGCAQVIPPGEGTSSKAAGERLDEEERSATVANALSALTTADLAPADVRARRKASELAVVALARGRVEDKARVRAASTAVVERLATSTETCIDSALAARVEAAAGRLDQAADLLVRAADACHTSRATIAAARALRAAKRCPEAVRAVERGWPNGAADEWIALMDQVSACSNEVSLRRNLGFVPETVREDYFALLAAREREREQRELDERADARARAAEERRQSERFEARSRCSSYCGSAESSCISSCAGGGPCMSRCSALRSACLAGCQ
jgi:hypothetical protein